jgi:transposase
MTEPARARRLSDEEGRRLQQIVRRGKRGSVRVRPAMIIMASASGTLVSAIALLVAADQDTVRDVIHLFNAKGLAALDPRWAGGRPRRISDDDVAVIVAAAGTRPERLGLPFTHWNLRKLAAYSAGRGRPARIGLERLRQILHAHGISFQRTRTWKESADPGRQAGPDRVRDQSLPGSLLRLRPVRAAVHPARPRQRLGGTQAAGPAAREPTPDPWRPLFPRLLQRGRDQLWAGGRTGGHGVIGAQTGGRAPAGRPGQRPGTSRA